MNAAPIYRRNTDSSTWWCRTHNRPATHFRTQKQRRENCCDPILGGIMLPCDCTKGFSTDDLHAARYEHAWMLRAEGLRYREIAIHLGLSEQRCSQMVRRFGIRVRRALRKARFCAFVRNHRHHKA